MCQNLIKINLFIVILRFEGTFVLPCPYFSINYTFQISKAGIQSIYIWQRHIRSIFLPFLRLKHFSVCICILVACLAKISFHYAHVYARRVPECCLLICLGLIAGELSGFLKFLLYKKRWALNWRTLKALLLKFWATERCHFDVQFRQVHISIQQKLQSQK